jgi:DNA-binding GntR family transcriptional regulator
MENKRQMDRQQLKVTDSALSMGDLTVERGVLPDGIVKALRAAIFSGQLKSGQRLNEKELASYLKVSRAPLREAFVRLEQEGLVTKTPHRGAVVTEFSENDVIEIYSLRIPLEGFAARLVAEKESPGSELKRLRAAYERLVEKGKEGDIRSFLTADFEFHRMIWEATGNERLVRILVDLCTPFFGFSLIQVVGEGKLFSTARAALEHQSVVEALENRNPTLAEEVMRQTISLNRMEFINRCWNARGDLALPEPVYSFPEQT